MRGMNLALDFAITPGLFKLLDELDEVIVDLGGRFYLTKDARVNEKTFKQGYPMLKQFEKVRKQYDKKHIFQSLQSQRVGL
jgi:FAD/FMN-containing dehydrogenase